MSIQTTIPVKAEDVRSVGSNNVKKLLNFSKEIGISPEFAQHMQSLRTIYQELINLPEEDGLIQQGNSTVEAKAIELGSKLDKLEASIKQLSTHDLQLFSEEITQMAQAAVNKYTLGISYDRFKTESVDCFPALVEYEMKHAKNLLIQYSNLYQNLIKQNLLSIAEIRADNSTKRTQQDKNNEISKYIDSIKSYKINIQRANNRFFETMDLIAHIIQKWVKLQSISIQNIRS